MRRAIHAGHVRRWHEEKWGLVDYLMEAAYIIAFALMLGLMLMPYLSRFF